MFSATSVRPTLIKPECAQGVQDSISALTKPNGTGLTFSKSGFSSPPFLSVKPSPPHACLLMSVGCSEIFITMDDKFGYISA